MEEEGSVEFNVQSDDAHYQRSQSMSSALNESMINAEGNIRQGSRSPTPHVQPEEEILIETFFGEGSLGVTLRRHADSGIVFVFDIIPTSQAVHIDVQPGDELWSVGEFDIGRTPLDKDAWKHMIDYIKESARPLRMVWLRKPNSTKSAAPSSRESSPTKEAHSYEYLELEKLLARLVFKDPKQGLLPLQSTKRTAPDLSSTLLQEGRHILRQGELLATLKSSTNRKPTAKRVILMSDMLLIASPQTGNMYAVDHVVELIACKVRSLGQVFGGEQTNPFEHSGSVGLDASFDLLWPGGELQLVAESREVKEVWVLNIYLAICECVSPESRVLGWRHQYMLGTVHAAVLSRDEGRIRELVGYCEAGLLDYLAIDTADEDGFTPLHYACMLRMQNIIRALHEATADVTAKDSRGFTALHWSAVQLDHSALAMLCSHVFDIDLHDSQDRTPLFLACLEGRNAAGKLDPSALRDCLKVMLSHKPDISYQNSLGETLLHHLGGSWQYEALELIINAGIEDINSLDKASGMTPLHYAVLGDLTKAPPGEAMRIMNLPPSSNAENSQSTEPTSIDGVETLHSLLKYGAKMNIKDALGRTALSLLLDPAQGEKWHEEDLEAAVAVMLSCGCRADDANVASIKARFPEMNVGVLVEKWTSLPAIDCAKLEIKVNQFEPVGSVEENSAVSLKSDPTKGTKCKLCQASFTMFKRNHHCRLCNILCCDDCSKKRCTIDNTQVRCCDSCFNRVLTLDEKLKAQEMLSNIRPLSKSITLETEESSTMTEKEKKESLFGFSFTGDSRRNQGNVKPAQQAGGNVSATMGVMNETHEKLQERGEKLSRLQDRTEEMSNQAGEFARLAKQLNEQQKARWF